MKISLPVHHFLPQYSAGAELYTFRLASWLQAAGHTVEVICVESLASGAPNELTTVTDSYQGLTVHRLSFNLARADDPARASYDNPLLGAWFAEHFARVSPDLAHFQAGYLLGAAPLRAAARAGVPTVLTLHDYWFICPRITLQRGDGSLCTRVPDDPAACAWCQRLASRRYRYPDRITGGRVGQAMRALALHDERRQMADRRSQLAAALALPDAVLAPSQFLASQVRPFVPADRLHVSRLGLDLTPFHNVARPAADGVFRIGFTGQVAPHKGVHLLIEAFEKLAARGRAIELHLYGGLEAWPDYVARLRKRSSGKPEIVFHGRFKNEEVAQILSSVDVAVVPSLWFENSPLAILEAHAAGTPVVTAALGGMAELVRDEVDGLHFRQGSADDLARQLQRLLDEPQLLPRLRAGVVKPRSIDDEMRQIMAIYDQVAARPALPIPEVV